MDTFENTNLPTPDQEPLGEVPQPAPLTPDPALSETPQAPQEAPQQEPVYQPYQNPVPPRQEPPRKASPYENSPYVMHHGSQQEYQYQPQTQKPPKQKKEKKQRASGGIGRRILSLLLTVALVAGGCLITANTVNNRWEQKHQASMDTLTQRIAALESQSNLQAPAAPGSSGPSIPVDGSAMNPTQLYEACVDSVVAISSTVSAPGLYGYSEGASSGSGFILSAEGYVVTNYHVVQDATAIDVILHDGSEHAAETVGFDSSNDLAVLKLKEAVEGLKPAALGSSSALNIGDMVVAIGNPLGELASTQTVGYVSGIDREVTTDNTIINMIQTDAAINPGNSGGPLFNMYGQVIGITTAKYSGTTGSGASIEGIGFAIPIDDISGMIADLVDYGYVTGAYLGVTVQNMDPASADLYGLPTGAYVVSVVEGGSAHKAGVQAKDIIIDLGGHKVGSINDLTRALRNFKAGDTTTITVIRSGRELALEILLDEKPRDLNAPIPAEEPALPEKGSYDEWYDYFRWYFGE